MIGYDIDLEKPYIVLESDINYVLVFGTSKVLQTTDGEFGGVCGAWCVHKRELLSREQRQQLRWVRKHLGDRHADKIAEEMYAHEISSHSQFVGG